MLGIRRIERVRNEEVLQRVQRSNLQLRSLWHWIQKDNIIKCFGLYTNCYGKNRGGRPRLNCNKHIQNFTNLTTEELLRKVLNRQEIWSGGQIYNHLAEVRRSKYQALCLGNTVQMSLYNDSTLHINIYLHREYHKTSFICCLIVTAENLIWLLFF